MGYYLPNLPPPRRETDEEKRKRKQKEKYDDAMKGGIGNLGNTSRMTSYGYVLISIAAILLILLIDKYL